MKPIRSLIPIVLIASVAAATPVRAETRVVSYADLDLASPQGQAALDSRISRAIHDVCGRPFPTDLQSQRQVDQCLRETRAGVQAQRNDALAQAQNSRIQFSARR